MDTTLIVFLVAAVLFLVGLIIYVYIRVKRMGPPPVVGGGGSASDRRTRVRGQMPTQTPLEQRVLDDLISASDPYVEYSTSGARNQEAQIPNTGGIYVRGPPTPTGRCYIPQDHRSRETATADLPPSYESLFG